MIRVKATLTADIGKKGYRELPVVTCESFAIDSAMDTDADQFSIDIGAPTPALSFLFDRDNEVRATIFTEHSQTKAVKRLHSGIADVLGYSSDDFVVSIAGRDLSCLATDSQAPPGETRGVRPHVFVTKEARALGFSQFRLSEATNFKKFYRTGSESYWESWARMYRHRNMWMWTEPDGRLLADKLHYSNSPKYFFGDPKANYGSPGQYFKVTRCEITKSTQGRVGEVWVFGDRGDIGFVGKAKDPSIVTWVRKPLKIITDSAITSKNEAIKEAWEEIFEGKVGSLEVKITVPLSQVSLAVNQNEMALVNLPMMGLTGIFFVVGVRISGSSDGYVMEVRLREKNFAISRRRPSDPVVQKDQAAASAIPTDIGASLGVRWGTWFAAAALQYHGGWDYNLFLGVLLSICHHESHFKNVREGSFNGPEWYARPVTTYGEAIGDILLNTPGQSGQRTSNEIEQWKKEFANYPDNPLNPYHNAVGRDKNAGVGPMQLTSEGYKKKANQLAGKDDEYSGGMWMPQFNILAGAYALSTKLEGLDPKTDSNIWIGVERYNGSGAAARKYRDEIHQIWVTNYKDSVAAVTEAKIVPAGETTDVTVNDENGSPFTVEVPVNAPDQIKRLINVLLRQRGKPYEWAAEGPNTFDCSGLAYYGYNQAGVKIPRGSTYSFVADKSYQKITKDRLLPGDMVFFSNTGDLSGDVHHMGIYLNDGHMIHAPHTGDVVKISPMLSGYWGEQYCAARRVIPWGVDTRPAQETEPQPSQQGPFLPLNLEVMIQAGHDTGGHGDQPYGHTGESGAAGEVNFTIAVRDKVLALLDTDQRFRATKGDAWSASAGATSDPADDINYNGGLFLSIHYDAPSGSGSRYFFGWPTGRGAAVEAKSIELRDAIRGEYEKITGHPTYNAGLNNSNEALYGYYAWGHPSRTSPNDIDHTPNAQARLLIETGEGGVGGDDVTFLTNRRSEIARAIYRGICIYYGLKPIG